MKAGRSAGRGAHAHAVGDVADLLPFSFTAGLMSAFLKCRATRAVIFSAALMRWKSTQHLRLPRVHLVVAQQHGHGFAVQVQAQHGAVESFVFMA